jgi:hypothetical protein
MRRFSYRSFVLLSFAGLTFAQWHTSAIADPGRPVDRWLQDVSTDYAEDGWVQKPNFRPLGYMRPTDDKGWQTRMLALRAVVMQGKSSIPSLLKALESGDVSRRVFAAQALGYLGADVPPKPLLRAAREDKLAAVRLYAIDALGMRGESANTIDWMSLRKQERNGDVRKHIGYGVERKDAAIHESVIQTLKNWNPQSINTAVVGKPAPDFELTSATKQKIRLSSFRGKKSVVLVFVYGDT